MDYGELLELIMIGCDNTDCNHCNLNEICCAYEISPTNIKNYLIECNKKLFGTKETS